MSFQTDISGYSPSLWWKLFDPVGTTTCVDSSGNGRTGTVFIDSDDSPTIVSAVFGQPFIVPNDAPSTCVLMGGAAGDYITESTGFTPAGSGTMLISVKSPSNDNKSMGTGVRIFFGREGNENIGIYTNVNGSVGAGVVGAYDYAAGTWRPTNTLIADGNAHFVCLVYQLGVASGCQLYVDGVAAGNAFTLGANSNTNRVRLGAPYFPGEEATGFFQEAIYLTQQLTAGQITILYNDWLKAILTGYTINVPAIAQKGTSVTIPVNPVPANATFTGQQITFSAINVNGAQVGSFVGGPTFTLNGGSQTVTYNCPAVAGPVLISSTNNSGLTDLQAYS